MQPLLEPSDTTAEAVAGSIRSHDAEFVTSPLVSSTSSYTTTLLTALDTDDPVRGAKFASSFTDAYAKRPTSPISFTVSCPAV